MIDVLEMLSSPSPEGLDSELAHNIARRVVAEDCRLGHRPRIVGETACKVLDRAREIHGQTDLSCEHARAIAVVEVAEDVADEYGVPPDTEIIIDALQLAADADGLAAELAGVASPYQGAVELVDEFQSAILAFGSSN